MHIEKIEVYRDVDGQWRWRALAANGLKVADSAEGYHNEKDCLDALNLVLNMSPSTPVINLGS